MESINRILIATDGSVHTQPAVQKGISLAKLLGAKVTALYVVEPTPVTSTPSDSSVIFSIHAIIENEGKKAVEDVRHLGEEMGVEVETMVLHGSPVKKILEIAEDHDLIVIGTLGRTGLSKLFMGSVAERVTRYAPCPVLVVRGRR